MGSGKILEEHVWLEILLWLFLGNIICHVYPSRNVFYIGEIVEHIHFCNLVFSLHISFHISNVFVQAAKTILQTGWVINWNLFITVLEAGSLKSGYQRGSFLMRALLWIADGIFLLYPHMGAREHSGVS